jgi:hypothetical protein
MENRLSKLILGDVGTNGSSRHDLLPLPMAHHLAFLVIS